MFLPRIQFGEKDWTLDCRRFLELGHFAKRTPPPPLCSRPLTLTLPLVVASLPPVEDLYPRGDLPPPPCSRPLPIPLFSPPPRFPSESSYETYFVFLRKMSYQQLHFL